MISPHRKVGARGPVLGPSTSKKLRKYFSSSIPTEIVLFDLRAFGDHAIVSTWDGCGREADLGTSSQRTLFHRWTTLLSCGTRARISRFALKARERSGPYEIKKTAGKLRKMRAQTKFSTGHRDLLTVDDISRAFRLKIKLGQYISIQVSGLTHPGTTRKTLRLHRTYQRNTFRGLRNDGIT